ncbi:MAG TPA: thioredoxin fold domain-containing protein [Thermoanaerobaculia bacterium]|jgi:hypothetical protein
MARNDQRSVPITLLVVAAVLLLARVVLHFNRADDASGVKWLTIEQGIERARSSDKPILFDFTAEWCAPCHLLDAQVFADPKLAAEINRQFIPVRVTDRQQEDGRNTPEVAALQQRFGVTGFPTLIFADAMLTERARMEGFSGRRQFEQVMKQVR